MDEELKRHMEVIKNFELLVKTSCHITTEEKIIIENINGLVKTLQLKNFNQEYIDRVNKFFNIKKSYIDLLHKTFPEYTSKN